MIKYAITNDVIKYAIKNGYAITNNVIKYAIKNDHAITNDDIKYAKKNLQNLSQIFLTYHPHRGGTKNEKVAKQQKKVYVQKISSVSQILTGLQVFL